MSDFGNYVYPKAGKEHKCAFCSKPIAIGETHTQYAGVYDGQWQNWSMHNLCFEFIQVGLYPGEPFFFCFGDGAGMEREIAEFAESQKAKVQP